MSECHRCLELEQRILHALHSLERNLMAAIDDLNSKLDSLATTMGDVGAAVTALRAEVAAQADGATAEQLAAVTSKVASIADAATAILNPPA